MPLTRIISGGQTGADRAGLDAAIYCQVPHGGWTPKGRRSEDGTIPVQYELNEMPTPDYEPRTEANVVDSDATVVFTERMATGGSLRTLEFCMKHGKPYIHISLGITTRQRAVRNIIDWLGGDPQWNDYDEYDAKPTADCVLNVAGARESQYPGVGEMVFAIMVDVIRAVNPECRQLYPVGFIGKGLALN